MWNKQSEGVSCDGLVSPEHARIVWYTLSTVCLSHIYCLSEHLYLCHLQLRLWSFITIPHFPFTHMHSVLDVLTFIRLPSVACLHLSRVFSTCSTLTTDHMSSANRVHRDSCLISSANMSIIIADKKELRADPWCNPTSTLNMSITAIINVLHYSYILLSHFQLSHTVAQLLSRHHVICFL